MDENFRMPAWGPAVDPAPDDPFGYGAGWGWHRRVPFPPWDPVDWRDRFKDILKPEDMVALDHAKLESMRAVLQAETAFANARTKAQMGLLTKQMEILQKYSG